ncbi:MAG: Ig domain-containing protein, partial [Chloroflexota bacterium]
IFSITSSSSPVNAQITIGVNATYHGVMEYPTFNVGTLQYDAWSYGDVALYTPPGKININQANLWLAWYHRVDELYRQVTEGTGRTDFDLTYRADAPGLGRKKMLGHPHDSCGAGCGNKQKAEAVGILDRLVASPDNYVDHWILFYEMGRAGGNFESFYGRATWPTNTIILPHLMAGMSFYVVGGSDAAIEQGTPGHLLNRLDAWTQSGNRWVDHFVASDQQSTGGYNSHDLIAAMFYRILQDTDDINTIVAILNNMSNKPSPSSAQQAMCDFQRSIREATGDRYTVKMVHEWGLPEGCGWAVSVPNRAPTISLTWSGYDLGGTVGQINNGVTFSANDPDGDSLTFSANGLPPGLNINSSNGTITGVYQQAGSFRVTVTVSDGRGGTDSVSFGWNVTGGDTSPQPTPTPTRISLPPPDSNRTPTISLTWSGYDLGGTVGQINNGVTFRASDPDGDSLTFSANGLPPGLNINSSNGTITGVYQQAGSYRVTVTVSDGRGGTDSVSFGWNVIGSPDSTDSPLVEENFTSTVGAGLDNAGGGRGWSGNWQVTRNNEAAIIQSGNLTIGIPNPTGNALLIKHTTENGNGLIAERALATPRLSGDVWFAYQVTARTVGNGHFFVGPTSSLDAAVGKSWGTQFAINNTRSSKPMQNGLNYLVVAKYELNANGADSVYLWVNPNLDTEPSISGADASATVNINAIDGIQINVQDYGQGEYWVDGLRLGITWPQLNLQPPTASPGAVATPTPPSQCTSASPVQPVIIRNGFTGVRLEWTTPLVGDQYEIWRSESAYFTPGDSHPSTRMIETYTDSNANSDANNGVFSYVDNESGIGDPAVNHAYLIRTVASCDNSIAESIRVGEFDYVLRETGTTDFNWIGLPLMVDSISDGATLIAHIQNNTSRNGSQISLDIHAVDHWNSVSQSSDTYLPQLPFLGDVNVNVGGVYRVSVDLSGTPPQQAVWSMVGPIPAANIFDTMLRATGGTDFNWVMAPLDKPSLRSGALLNDDVDNHAINLSSIEKWNDVGQSYDSHLPAFTVLGDIEIRPGMPVRLTVDGVAGEIVWR